jgi:hypothetical protein
LLQAIRVGNKRQRAIIAKPTLVRVLALQEAREARA